jgi:hypothetical protein
LLQEDLVSVSSGLSRAIKIQRVRKVKQDQDQTVEYRKKNEARSENVINELASVDANKRRSVTWDPNIIINDKRKKNDGWTTVTRRNGNRRKELW